MRATRAGEAPLLRVTRTFLPVLGRRAMLRGIAATVAGALAGCRLSLDQGPIESGPDAGAGGTTGGGTGAGSGSSGSGGMVQCSGGFCLDLSDPANAALRDAGGARVVAIGNAHVIVVRVNDSEFDALSAVCTHAGCLVGYSTSSADLVCPCHGSQFDASTDIVTIAVAA